MVNAGENAYRGINGAILCVAGPVNQLFIGNANAVRAPDATLQYYCSRRNFFAGLASYRIRIRAAFRSGFRSEAQRK